MINVVKIEPLKNGALSIHYTENTEGNTEFTKGQVQSLRFFVRSVLTSVFSV